MSQTNNNNGSARPRVVVFVVDDEPMLLDLAVAILEPQGFDVRTYRDPRQALKDFPAAKPAVVVTDYAMGDTLNGMDMVRECRLINPRQKILLVSGTVDEDVFAGSDIKPDVFLAKPYQVHMFVKAIRDLAAG
jgi:DNA-binding response OmpR family regulator